ncbi:hypothetical protein MUB04_16245 [Acinetobacter indicus]|uniref:hypothetical protein n=1 Tax=Acinetobacter TaxID=469 RepID=UPI0015D34249|nr:MULTISPECIES: hypothetical protein [Acinetobacter]MCP0918091.1 hypothetical protein [Acinetobacter indicus]
MDYLISPFGFPPVGYELPKEIDNQVSTRHIDASYKEVYALLQMICEKNLWRNHFQDKNRVEQTRFFSTSKYYYLSGYQIRGLAELHLALKYHLDTTVKLEESRIGLPGTYCFDLQTRIDNFEKSKIVSSAESSILIATWTKTEFNVDLSIHDDEKSYTHASYPLHYIKLSQNTSLNLVSYEDFFPLFKELGIQDYKTKKYVLSFFESYIFSKAKILRVDLSEKRLINAKIIMMHILGRFLCIESQIVSEYLDAKLYSWNVDITGEYTIFFSAVLNAIFGFIDDLIILKEKASAKNHGINTESIYQLFKSDFFYNFEKMENADIVDQLNSENYQPLDDDNDSEFNTTETESDYRKVMPDLIFDTETIIDFPQQADSDTIEFVRVDKVGNSFSLEPIEEIPKKQLLSGLEFDGPVSQAVLHDGSIGKKISADDFAIFDLTEITEIEEKTAGLAISENNQKAPPYSDFSQVEYTSPSNSVAAPQVKLETNNSSYNKVELKKIPEINEKSILKVLLNLPYDESANIRIANAKGSVDLVLKQKEQEVETHANDFDSTFDLRSTETFITHDTSVQHEDIVKKVTESRQLVSIEEKRKAVIAMHDAVKIKHPFVPRLTDVAAWTVLTKKWLHLLSFVETKSVVNIPIANRSTYFDLMCLKQNVLKSWSKLESGYLQHQYLKSIAFDVFNTIYETWEYRQYLDDMSKTVIDKAVSLTKIRCAYNLTTHETIEWAKLTEEQLTENMFIESFHYKFDIVLPEMRKDKISDLKTAFTQLYDNVQNNYMKVFGKYPGASHIFRLAVIIFDLLILNAHETADYSLEFQDDIFSILSEFKADFHDARNLNGLNEDKFYVQAILTDIEPFVRRRISPEKFLSFA